MCLAAVTLHPRCHFQPLDLPLQLQGLFLALVNLKAQAETPPLVPRLVLVEAMACPPFLPTPPEEEQKLTYIVFFISQVEIYFFIHT